MPESIGSLRNLQQITLINTAIRSLPESIGNLPLLENLTISHAPISTLPNSIGNIRNLALHLSSTQITELPDTITNLAEFTSPSSISLPPNLREHLASRRDMEIITLRSRQYRSHPSRRNATLLQNRPTLDFESRGNRPTFNTSNLTMRPGLHSNIEELYLSIGKVSPNFETIQNIPTIEEWLDRILSSKNAPIIAPLIIEILEYAEQSSAFRERLTLNIEEALSTCDDRISLYINHIYMEKKLFSISQTNSSELLNFLLYTVFPISLLDEIASQKSIDIGIARRQENYEEEVETYLAYLTGINQRLSLGLPIPNMLFSILSKVEIKDIDAAEETLRYKMSHSNEYIPFLIEHPTWIAFLRTAYPQEMKEIEEKSVDLLDIENANSSELIQYTENVKKFRESHLTLLTQNHLNHIKSNTHS